MLSEWGRLEIAGYVFKQEYYYADALDEWSLEFNSFDDAYNAINQMFPTLLF